MIYIHIFDYIHWIKVHSYTIFICILKEIIIRLLLLSWDKWEDKLEKSQLSHAISQINPSSKSSGRSRYLLPSCMNVKAPQWDRGERVTVKTSSTTFVSRTCRWQDAQVFSAAMAQATSTVFLRAIVRYSSNHRQQRNSCYRDLVAIIRRQSPYMYAHHERK